MNITTRLRHGRVRAHFSNFSSGQFLIESMISISIITVGLLGILTLLSSALSLNRVVADQYKGIYLASEGIEVVKSMIDRNVILGAPTQWNSGFNNGSFEVEYSSDDFMPLTGNPFLFKDGIYSYALGGIATPYRRTITIQLIGFDEMRVNSNVTWITRGGGNFSVNLEDTFFNWR